MNNIHLEIDCKERYPDGQSTAQLGKETLLIKKPELITVTYSFTVQTSNTHSNKPKIPTIYEFR